MSRNSLPKQQVRSDKIPVIVVRDYCTSQVNTDACIKLSWSGWSIVSCETGIACTLPETFTIRNVSI